MSPPALISETFVSLQGEGALTGTPSWFVRFSGCNLRCRWCDTPYASWSPEGEKRTVDTLADEAAGSGVRHAVVTGGEPLIFPQCAELCARLRRAGLHVTIETAGTVEGPAPDTHAECDLLSLSPKLRNSTPSNDPRDPLGVWGERHEQRRLNPDALRALLDRAPDVQCKFVVTGEQDLAEIDAILAEINRGQERLKPHQVFLMPEGTSIPNPARVAWVVRLCLERGWRYAHRLHIELFGDTKGT